MAPAYVLAFALVVSMSGPIEIPHRAEAHRRTLIREAHRLWGLDAPIARFAAQIHQESAWRPNVSSQFASGLTQFTPATAKDMGRWYPSELGVVSVFDPNWAIRALILYDKRLYDSLTDIKDECDRWAMVMSAYNGGLGWVNRDRRRAAAAGANKDRWWGHVEHYTSRAGWAKKENRAYVQRILRTLEPVYVAAGWGGIAVCEPPEAKV